MSKVLIALDYSPAAQKVAETGISRCENLGDDIVLLHVIDEAYGYATAVDGPLMGFGGYTDTGLTGTGRINQLKKDSRAYLVKVKEHCKGRNITTLVLEGNTAETIHLTARALEAREILIGSHSRRWMETTFLGAVPEYLLRHAEIPLLIIPTKKR